MTAVDLERSRSLSHNALDALNGRTDPASALATEALYASLRIVDDLERTRRYAEVLFDAHVQKAIDDAVQQICSAFGLPLPVMSATVHADLELPEMVMQ